MIKFNIFEKQREKIWIFEKKCYIKKYLPFKLKLGVYFLF